MTALTEAFRAMSAPRTKVSLDPGITRRLIAVVVIVFAVVMLAGIRFHSRQRLGTGVALGLMSGALRGATGLGGPPVILNLLAGPDPLPVTRANLMIYVTMISLAGLLAPGLAGAILVYSRFGGASGWRRKNGVTWPARTAT